MTDELNRGKTKKKGKDWFEVRGNKLPSWEGSGIAKRIPRGVVAVGKRLCFDLGYHPGASVRQAKPDLSRKLKGAYP